MPQLLEPRLPFKNVSVRNKFGSRVQLDELHVRCDLLARSPPLPTLTPTPPQPSSDVALHQFWHAPTVGVPASAVCVASCPCCRCYSHMVVTHLLRRIADTCCPRTRSFCG